MPNVQAYSSKQPAGRASARPHRPLAWLKLAAGLLLVLLFIFGLGNLSHLIPGARRMGQVIEAHQLRATAIFYTDFDTSAEAAESIRHRLTYPPQHPTLPRPAAGLQTGGVSTPPAP